MKEDVHCPVETLIWLKIGREAAENHHDEYSAPFYSKSFRP